MSKRSAFFHSLFATRYSPNREETLPATRREFFASLSAIAAAVAARPPRAAAQDLPRPRFAMGTKSMNATTINMVIGEGLGYNREAGFRMEPVPLGSISSAQIALDKGNVEFAVGAPSFQLPLLARQELPALTYFY